MLIGGLKENVLINRIAQGDQTAFELIFKFYYPGLVIFATQFVLSKDDAEEIVQDFFIYIWQNKHKLNNADSLKPYFFTSIKNRSLNLLKKNKIKHQLIEKLKILSRSDLSYNPDIFVESELQTKIQNSFKSIPPKTREVFLLSRNDGFTNSEIAQQLNISKRTVETHISNALKILRRELKEYLTLLLLIDIFLG